MVPEKGIKDHFTLDELTFFHPACSTALTESVVLEASLFTLNDEKTNSNTVFSLLWWTQTNSVYKPFISLPLNFIFHHDSSLLSLSSLHHSGLLSSSPGEAGFPGLGHHTMLLNHNKSRNIFTLQLNIHQTTYMQHLMYTS